MAVLNVWVHTVKDGMWQEALEYMRKVADHERKEGRTLRAYRSTGAFSEGANQKLYFESEFESLGEIEKSASEFFASDFWQNEGLQRYRACFEPHGTSHWQYEIVM